MSNLVGGKSQFAMNSYPQLYMLYLYIHVYSYSYIYIILLLASINILRECFPLCAQQKRETGKQKEDNDRSLCLTSKLKSTLQWCRMSQIEEGLSPI